MIERKRSSNYKGSTVLEQKRGADYKDSNAPDEKEGTRMPPQKKPWYRSGLFLGLCIVY